MVAAVCPLTPGGSLGEPDGRYMWVLVIHEPVSRGCPGIRPGTTANTRFGAGGHPRPCRENHQPPCVTEDSNLHHPLQRGSALRVAGLKCCRLHQRREEGAGDSCHLTWSPEISSGSTASTLRARPGLEPGSGYHQPDACRGTHRPSLRAVTPSQSSGVRLTAGLFVCVRPDRLAHPVPFSLRAPGRSRTANLRSHRARC